MLKIGIPLSAKDLASGALRQFGTTSERETGRAQSGFVQLGQTIDRVSTRLVALGTGAKLFGDSVLAEVMKPVSAYARLDDATTDLQVTMPDRTGKIGPFRTHVGMNRKRRQAWVGGLRGGDGDWAGGTVSSLDQGTPAVTRKYIEPRQGGFLVYRRKNP